jgi:hypothetical protein
VLVAEMLDALEAEEESFEADELSWWLAVRLHRAYCRRITAIDFFPHGEYVLFIITKTSLEKAKGEEAWKPLKVPLQANRPRLNGSCSSASVTGARRHS